MISRRIQLSEDLAEQLDEAVNSGRFADASEYLGDLLRQDRDRQLARHQLESLIQEGVGSGEAIDFSAEAWQRLREAARQQAKRSA